MYVSADVDGWLLNALEKRAKQSSMSKAAIVKQALFEFLNEGENGKRA